MKKITITLLTLFIGVFGLFSQSNWKWTIQESGTTEALRDVFFLNDMTGWAVGDNGTILNTLNGGALWTAQTSNTDQRLSSVHFIDENTGWITGGQDSGEQAPLLKTTDGGQNWQLMSYSFSAAFVKDIFFVDDSTGWVIKSDSIYISKDGGVSWTTERFASSVESPLDNVGIYAISDEVAFVAGSRKISGTTKTATVFDRRPQIDPAFWGFDGSNQIDNSETLKCITFADDSVGFLGGNQGKIYRLQLTSEITNGPWVLNHELPQGNTIWSISFANSDVGMFNVSTDIDNVTVALVYHTEDQGENWTSIPDTIPDMFSATLFAGDKNNAWIVAVGGKIYKGIPSPSSIFDNRPEINFSIFPNPTTGLLTINNPDGHKKLTISVVNISGQLISEFIMENAGKIEINIDGNPGIYFVKAISENGGQRVIKVIKK